MNVMNKMYKFSPKIDSAMCKVCIYDSMVGYIIQKKIILC